jgi:hypothetical protein
MTADDTERFFCSSSHLALAVAATELPKVMRSVLCAWGDLRDEYEIWGERDAESEEDISEDPSEAEELEEAEVPRKDQKGTSQEEEAGAPEPEEETEELRTFYQMIMLEQALGPAPPRVPAWQLREQRLEDALNEVKRLLIAFVPIVGGQEMLDIIDDALKPEVVEFRNVLPFEKGE